MPHYEGKEFDEQVAAVFPNIPIDHRIVEAFQPVDPITDMRREMGIDLDTYSAIMNGTLDAVLKEYA
jgi:hypothetical protein